MTIAIVRFPVELLKLITTSLSDNDLCNFALTCSIFHDAVHGDQVVWRNRFLSVYDDPVNKISYNWQATYQKRQRLHKKIVGLSFCSGQSKEELEDLEILWDILADARGNIPAEGDPVDGRNFSYILPLRSERAIFSSHSHVDAHPLLSAVSLLLTPLLNRPKLAFIKDSQEIVYKPDINRVTNADGTPNLSILNAIARLFTWHIHPDSSSDLFHQRTLLTPGEMPAFWQGRMGEEGKIPTKWFGAYTFSNHTRITYDGGELSSDRSDGYLVDMMLDISQSGTETSGTSTAAFTGIGKDFDTFTIKSGEITPIPSPSGRLSTVHGWKKVEFTKSYTHHGWYYSGIILPGNNMMLGYWMRSNEGLLSRGASGPFIFWRAPESSSLLNRDNRVSFVRVTS
ncbi:hypothetical protein DFP73DRAFT_542092 [Morchella snyderi]|nr:hypothetical protein DFP73DRAFT_542092 [Morchella snyderi]